MVCRGKVRDKGTGVRDEVNLGGIERGLNRQVRQERQGKRKKRETLFLKNFFSLVLWIYLGALVPFEEATHAGLAVK
jgi:hypothetical protein